MRNPTNRWTRAAGGETIGDFRFPIADWKSRRPVNSDVMCFNPQIFRVWKYGATASRNGGGKNMT